MKKNQLLLISILLMFFPFTLKSQKIPIKFGEVDIENLTMKKYANDTSASAIVICEYGHSDVKNSEFVYIRRVKILKKSGVYHANFTINAPLKTQIMGYTYNLFAKGEVEKEKLEAKNIYKEKTNQNHVRLKVAMPNAREGSIVEIKVTYRRFPSVWTFQEEIPVMWSELRLDPLRSSSLSMHYSGYTPLTISTPTRWVVQNIPAVHEEPYMNSIFNYIAKLEIEPSKILTGGYYKDISATWEGVSKTLHKDDDFGKRLKKVGILREKLKEIEEQYPDKEEQLRAIYEKIKEMVNWNETSRLYSFDSWARILENGWGSSADINLMLIACLKKLDYEVYPVALSTRNNGMLSPTFPSLNKLNYVIALVKLEDKTIFLDATEKYLPMGMLPKRCLNGQGRIIDDGKTDWVNLEFDGNDAYKRVYANLEIQESGDLTGELSCLYKDYGAYLFRKDFQWSMNHDEFVKDFENKNPGLIIKNPTFNNLQDIYEPVTTKYNVQYKNKVDIIDDEIYLTPVLLEKIEKNPFNEEKRLYPIDFIHNYHEITILQYKIPEGYRIESIPESKSLKLQGEQVLFSYQISANENLISVSNRLIIKNPLIVQTEYELIRELFNEIVNKHAEVIILKKQQ